MQRVASRGRLPQLALLPRNVIFIVSETALIKVVGVHQLVGRLALGGGVYPHHLRYRQGDVVPLLGVELYAFLHVLPGVEVVPLLRIGDDLLALADRLSVFGLSAHQAVKQAGHAAVLEVLEEELGSEVALDQQVLEGVVGIAGLADQQLGILVLKQRCAGLGAEGIELLALAVDEDLVRSCHQLVDVVCDLGDSGVRGQLFFSRTQRGATLGPDQRVPFLHVRQFAQPVGHVVGVELRCTVLVGDLVIYRAEPVGSLLIEDHVAKPVDEGLHQLMHNRLQGFFDVLVVFLVDDTVIQPLDDTLDVAGTLADFDVDVAAHADLINLTLVLLLRFLQQLAGLATELFCQQLLLLEKLDHAALLFKIAVVFNCLANKGCILHSGMPDAGCLA